MSIGEAPVNYKSMSPKPTTAQARFEHELPGPTVELISFTMVSNTLFLPLTSGISTAQVVPRWLRVLVPP